MRRAGVLIVVAGLLAGCATVCRRYDFERTLASTSTKGSPMCGAGYRDDLDSEHFH